MRYRVSNTLDAEERLEDAAMAKAMHDVFGAEIVSEGEADFGRDRMFEGPRENIAYWHDPAFTMNANREVLLCDSTRAEHEIDRMHDSGIGAFIKATDLKLFTAKAPVGTSFFEAVGDYIWSIIDRPPCVLVQTLCDVRFEMRLVSVGREIVTHSPIAVHLTPIHRLEMGEMFETPTSQQSVGAPEVQRSLLALAKTVAAECQYDDVIIDCAMIDGKPGVIEFNPFSIGNFGLYACSPLAIAGAVKRKAMNVKTCRKCGGTMRPSKALAQTFTAGTPDFPGDTHASTFSAGGPGELIDCMKCEACGWSVTKGDGDGRMETD